MHLIDIMISTLIDIMLCYVMLCTLIDIYIIINDMYPSSPLPSLALPQRILVAHPLNPLTQPTLSPHPLNPFNPPY